jgi:WD40 repeat protein
MTRIGTLIALTVALSTFAAPAPRPPKSQPPLTPENVAKIEPVGEIARYAYRLVFGPGPGELSVLPWEESIEVFDVNTLKSVRRLAADRRLTHVAFTPDGDTAAWSDNRGTSVEIVNLRTGKGRTVEAGGRQAHVAFSPNGEYLATGVYGTVATLWKTATAEKVRTFETDTDGGLTMAFSRDGKMLALGNRNSTTSLYEVATGKPLHVLPRRMTHEIKFNPAGTVLAATYVNGLVALWDVATGKVLHERASGAEELYTLDWSPKGDLLVTAGRKGKITIWDPKDLKSLKELEAPEWVIQVRFSPDGSRLFTSGGSVLPSRDRRVQVWGLPTFAGR